VNDYTETLNALKSMGSSARRIISRGQARCSPKIWSDALLGPCLDHRSATHVNDGKRVRTCTQYVLPSSNEISEAHSGYSDPRRGADPADPLLVRRIGLERLDPSPGTSERKDSADRNSLT
jgi:hypothetical protein